MSFSPPVQPPPVGIDPQDIYRQPVAPHSYHMHPSYYHQIDLDRQYAQDSLSQHQYMQNFVPEPIPVEEKVAIYGAVYSGVPVYEMMCRSVAVMRRRSDSFLNATQILKVAGIDKGRRTKILEKEIQNGPHEKVQGGYGKYQGTWIPFERGVQLAQQYNVENLLEPLLNYAPQGGRADSTPTKEQVMALSRSNTKRSSKKQSRVNELQNDGYAESSKKRRSVEKEMVTPNLNILEEDPGFASYYTPYPNESLHSMYLQHASMQSMHLEPPSERHRSTLMAMFMNDDDGMIPDIMLPRNPAPPDFDVDLILDDQGHSAFHWAAALGRISLLKLLLQKGANPKKVNFNGETALMRAVLVSNNYDRLSFGTLLQILGDQLIITDKKNRTVLHHICLSASLKSGSQSCRYYMECVLDYILGQEAEQLTMQGSSSDVNLRCIINLCDINGDTPINIAARVGNRYLVDQLLEAGADPAIPNHFGLQPSDFGYDNNYVSIKEEAPRVVYPSIQTYEENNSFGACQDLIVNEDTDKTTSLNSDTQLQELTKELAKARKQNRLYREQVSQIPQLMQKIKNLEGSLESELQEKSMNSLLSPENSSQVLSDQEAALRQEIIKLRGNISQNEVMCKRIISICCGISLDQVDDIIQPLLEALESEESDIDVSQVASFMSRVREDSSIIS